MADKIVESRLQAISKYEVNPEDRYRETDLDGGLKVRITISPSTWGTREATRQLSGRYVGDLDNGQYFVFVSAESKCSIFTRRGPRQEVGGWTAG